MIFSFSIVACSNSHKNLAREKDIPGRDLYSLLVTGERDWIDQVVERLADLQPDLSSDVYQVTGRIARIATRIAQRQDEVFGRYGLNRGDVGVLNALRSSLPANRLSPTQLFRGLMLSSAGMTKRLDRLEQKGLVQRRPDANDRRSIIIELTPGGRRLVSKAVAENTRNEAAFLKGFSPNERRVLTDLLRRVLARAEPASGD